MKLLIEIDENIIEGAKSSPNYYPTYHFEKIWKAIVNGTPIPNNATNEDVVNSIFPDGLDISDFHWWKAPYKGGK